MRHLMICALLAGCGSPTLLIRNFDPGQEKAEIWVDGERVAMLAYKEDVSIPVEPGPHRIKALPAGASTSPWHPDAEYCEMVLEDDAVMTLVPPGAR